MRHICSNRIESSRARHKFFSTLIALIYRVVGEKQKITLQKHIDIDGQFFFIRAHVRPRMKMNDFFYI